jgi:hypothetical protein
MLSQGGKPFAVTFGLHGGYQIPDVVIAQRTARAVGQSWRTVDRTAYDGPGAPSDTDMLFLTDGSFASRMLAAVGLSARAGSDWIAIGLGADYLVGRTGGDVDPRKHRDVDGIARQLHGEFSREWPTAEQLRDMASLDRTHDEEEHLARWLKTWQEFTDLPPAEAYARHQMCYRQVGKLSPRLDSVRVFATPCYPYMCPDVFEAYLSLPDRLWAKGYAHILVPEKLAPPLRRVQARKLWPLPIPPRWEAAFGADRLIRIAVALLGGILLGFGSRWGGGCTSGHGISGALQLAISSWLAAICFFIGGIATAMLIFRVFAG